MSTNRVGTFLASMPMTSGPSSAFGFIGFSAKGFRLNPQRRAANDGAPRHQSALVRFSATRTLTVLTAPCGGIERHQLVACAGVALTTHTSFAL